MNQNDQVSTGIKFLIFAVAIVIVLSTRHVFADTVCPEAQGQWLTAAGDVECRPCLPIDAYDETTPIPRGCFALRAGILWTVTADAKTAGELAKLRTERDDLRAEAGKLGRDLIREKLDAAHALDDAASALDDCAVDLESVQAPSPWPMLSAGFGLGVLAGAALVLAFGAGG